MQCTLPLDTWQWTTGEPSPRSWIEKTPGVCGGQARVRRMRIPVWGIILSYRLGSSDADVLDALPALTPDDLHVARSYYESHIDEIETAIRLNEES